MNPDIFHFTKFNGFRFLTTDETAVRIELTDDSPYYAWAGNLGEVFGPLSGDDLYLAHPKMKGLGIYNNCTLMFPGRLCILQEDGKYKVTNGTSWSSQSFDQASSVHAEYVLVENNGQKQLLWPDLKTLTDLPQDISLASGLCENTVFILQDGIWNLYQKSGTSPDKVDFIDGKEMTLNYNVNIRDQPGKDGNILETWPKGTKVIVYEQKKIGDSELWGEIEQPGSGKWMCIYNADGTYLSEE